MTGEALMSLSRRFQKGKKAPAIVALHLVEQLNAFSEAYLSNGGKDIETLLFEENGGRHCFPPKVKEKAYSWLDRHLKLRIIVFSYVKKIF